MVDNAAQDFAQRFARAYLTYDAARPARRERAAAPRSSPTTSTLDAGLRPRGAPQRVLWTEVASNQEAIAGGRVIVVAAGVSTQDEPLYLAVPVERIDGAIGLTGYPSMVGPPIASRAALPERVEVEDRETLVVARRRSPTTSPASAEPRRRPGARARSSRCRATA